jgi:HEAT repeat protein
VSQKSEVQEQLRNLQSGNLHKKLKAIEVLRQHRTDPRVITAFTRALNDNEMIVRRETAYSLDTPGVVSKDVVHALAKCLLLDPESAVREAAADALGHIGPDAEDAVSALVEVLEKEENNGVLYNIVVALAYIGPDAEAAVPALQKKAREDRSLAEKCRWAAHCILDPTRRRSGQP